MRTALGIDLGTTNSVMATIRDGAPYIIPNREGERLTPSVVALLPDGKVLVGKAACSQAAENARNTVSSIKRKMGSQEQVILCGKNYTPPEISGMILRKLKEDAELFLGLPVTEAVITVPAYFDDRQRQDTKTAGQLAGLEVLRIINEPTSASLAYGLDREDVHTIVIWDLGGGTFDVSILELGNGTFTVKAVNGNTRLGGDDWDLRIMDFIHHSLLSRFGIDCSNNDNHWQHLREKARMAKEELSESDETSMSLPFLKEKSSRRLPVFSLTKAHFEALTNDLIENMVPPTFQALNDAGITQWDPDRLVLVGGSTRMPAVRRMAEGFFQKKPFCSINPDEVVALGAALQAGYLTGQIGHMTLLDVTPLSLGVETQGGLCAKIINRNTTIPTHKSQIFTTAIDNQTSIDINILQGERIMAVDNISLGKFSLEELDPLPRGMVHLEVTFSLNVNGILEVSACNIQTEEEEKLIITKVTSFSREEVESLLEEAKRREKCDAMKKVWIESLNAIRNMEESIAAFKESWKAQLEEAELYELEAMLSSIRETEGREVNETDRIVRTMVARLFQLQEEIERRGMLVRR